MSSEEQPISLGPCVYCGSDCYTLPSGKFWSSDPAPDCLCAVEEDEAEQRENLIVSIIKGQEEEEDAPRT